MERLRVCRLFIITLYFDNEGCHALLAVLVRLIMIYVFLCNNK